jgi:hypothetical protein
MVQMPQEIKCPHVAENWRAAHVSYSLGGNVVFIMCAECEMLIKSQMLESILNNAIKEVVKKVIRPNDLQRDGT